MICYLLKFLCKGKKNNNDKNKCKNNDYMSRWVQYLE